MKRWWHRFFDRHIEHYRHVYPEEVRVGDHVLVVLEVFARGNGDRRNLYARPIKGERWVMGDQRMWTYGWRMKGEGPRIIRKERGAT